MEGGYSIFMLSIQSNVLINACSDSFKKQVEDLNSSSFLPLQVAKIQALSSKLEVQSSHLTADLQTCEQSRAGMAVESGRLIQAAQQTHDTRVHMPVCSINYVP